jgi:hypothetical protein
VAPTMGLQRPWEPEPGYCSVRVTACDPSSLIYLETIAGIQWIADI